jgi:HSP20 family molecular chaperone IbpA
MESSSRFSIFVIILVLSSILGLVEGFAICYIFSYNTLYLAATLGFSLLLVSSSVWFYYYFKKVGSYSLNGLKLAPLTQRPITREFGNVDTSYFRIPMSILEVQEGREQLVDVIDDKDTIHVVAELPIVGVNDINFDCLGKVLTLFFDVGNNRYYKEIELPFAVYSKSGKVKLRNWIVELDLTKIKVENSEESHLKQEL